MDSNRNVEIKTIVLVLYTIKVAIFFVFNF